MPGGLVASGRRPWWPGGLRKAALVAWWPPEGGPALPSPAKPCPDLPCPDLPCPALPCPALARHTPHATRSSLAGMPFTYLFTTFLLNDIVSYLPISYYSTTLCLPDAHFPWFVNINLYKYKYLNFQIFMSKTLDSSKWDRIALISHFSLFCIYWPIKIIFIDCRGFPLNSEHL